MKQSEEDKFMPWLDAKVAAEALDPNGADVGRYGVSTLQWAYVRDLVVALLDTGARLSEIPT